MNRKCFDLHLKQCEYFRIVEININNNIKTMKPGSLMFSFILTAVMALSCSKTPAATEPSKPSTPGEDAISLTLDSVQEKSITCKISLSTATSVNFAYIECIRESDGDAITEMLPSDCLGENFVEVQDLRKNTAYLLTAVADIEGRSESLRSETLKVTTGETVTLEVLSNTETSITCRVNVATGKTVNFIGITYKLQGSTSVERNILLENGASECTIDGLLEWKTYVLKPYASIDSVDELVYGKEVTASTKKEIIPDGDYKLVFSAEFNEDNEDLTKTWKFEEGSKIRNNEDQFYSRSKENAFTKDGCLHIVARRNHLGSDGKTHSYTSASMTTQDSFVYCYGRVEVRAKIPTGGGMWPAIWQVGNMYNWPQNGELDIMEYYRESILANVASGGNKQWSPTWFSSKHPMSKFLAKDPDWRNKFHIWVCEWDENYVRIYLDDDLLNEVSMENTFNKGVDNNYENPYRYNTKGFGHYLWLNLAIGVNNGGSIDNSLFPAEYLVDYVRVYQKQRLPEE